MLSTCLLFAHDYTQYTYFSVTGIFLVTDTPWSHARPDKRDDGLRTPPGPMLARIRGMMDCDMSVNSLCIVVTSSVNHETGLTTQMLF